MIKSPFPRIGWNSFQVRALRPPPWVRRGLPLEMPANRYWVSEEAGQVSGCGPLPQEAALARQWAALIPWPALCWRAGWRAPQLSLFPTIGGAECGRPLPPAVPSYLVFELRQEWRMVGGFAGLLNPHPLLAVCLRSLGECPKSLGSFCCCPLRLTEWSCTPAT